MLGFPDRVLLDPVEMADWVRLVSPAYSVDSGESGIGKFAGHMRSDVCKPERLIVDAVTEDLDFHKPSAIDQLLQIIL
jgi:hypothetical protein